MGHGRQVKLGRMKETSSATHFQEFISCNQSGNFTIEQALLRGCGVNGADILDRWMRGKVPRR